MPGPDHRAAPGRRTADPAPGNGGPGPHASPAGAEIAAVDEILQVMFWMRGEGLASDVGPRDLTLWIGLDEGEIGRLLARMERLGLVEGAPSADEARFRLTARGAEEGGRRFADEFAEITRSGHGECNDPECNDPECDCHATGRPEDCIHRGHPPQPR